MNSFFAFSNTVNAFAAAYFVHSTLLLTMCWLIIAIARPQSHFLKERMWKLAAVLGILTAFSQLLMSPNTLGIVMQSPADGIGVSDVSDELMFGATVATTPDPLEAGVEMEGDDVEIIYGNDPPMESNADSNPFDTRIDTMEPTVASTEALAPNVLDTDPKAQSRAEPLASTSKRLARNWAPVLLHCCAILLVCTFVVGGLVLILQTTRLCLRFGGARVLRTGTARTALDRFLKRHKIRGRIRLLASDKHCEPIAYGLFRWTIVLPEGAEDRLEPNELKALLAHEVAHLVRGDVRWLWIGRVLCTCCAFQPLNFLARRHWQQAAEYLCDDWALERGIRSISLARCLTRVAEWRFGVETSRIGLAAGGSKGTLVQRVERLVDEQPRRDAWKMPWRRRALTIGAALAVVMLAGFTPRVALPLTPVGDCGINANLNSIEALIDESAAGDWQPLEEELLQLEADLDRVDQLRDTAIEPPEVAERFQDLNRRFASLTTRREHIASLFEKESQ